MRNFFESGGFIKPLKKDAVLGKFSEILGPRHPKDIELDDLLQPSVVIVDRDGGDFWIVLASKKSKKQNRPK